MAKKQAYLIVGLPHSGVPALSAALEEHREALAAQGVRVPAKSADETFRAAVELRREHRAWGLRRKDVEGTWAGICRRLHKHPEPAVLGHELLAGAGPREIALLVDGLGGRDLHVVVLAGAPDARVAVLPDELDLESVLSRWSGAVASPDRVHVVVGGAAAAWTTLAGLLGVDGPPAHRRGLGARSGGRRGAAPGRRGRRRSSTRSSSSWPSTGPRRWPTPGTT